MAVPSLCLQGAEAIPSVWSKKMGVENISLLTKYESPRARTSGSSILKKGFLTSRCQSWYGYSGCHLGVSQYPFQSYVTAVNIMDTSCCYLCKMLFFIGFSISL